MYVLAKQANHDDFGDPVLLQQHVEIGIRKAAGPPMFLDDNIARLRREIRNAIRRPSSLWRTPAEALRRLRPILGFVPLEPG